MPLQSIAAAVQQPDERRTLDAIAGALVYSIGECADAQVPALAARLVDVLKRIGGEDPSTLVWLRDGLAAAVDRLVAVQGQFEDGRPLGTELAPTVRQLLATLDALAAHAGRVDGEVNPLDDIAAARARRRAARSSGTEAL